MKDFDESFHNVVRELPSFQNGMCYVIEFIDDFVPGQKMKITTEILPHIDVKELNVFITSQFDYVGIAVEQWDENRPFKINVPFGKDQIPNIPPQIIGTNRLNLT